LCKLVRQSRTSCRFSTHFSSNIAMNVITADCGAISKRARLHANAPHRRASFVLGSHLCGLHRPRRTPTALTQSANDGIVVRSLGCQRRTAACGGIRRMIDLLATLQRHFGHTSFRAGQEDLVRAVLDGQDVLAVMPTGSGKSLGFQLPAMLLRGTTLVVSPLISLMKDQVDELNRRGIRAVALHSEIGRASC